jgi:hypothetical protein
MERWQQAFSELHLDIDSLLHLPCPIAVALGSYRHKARKRVFGEGV